MAARWGSLLSQAVAGVESRLDNMLAEEDENGRAGTAVKPASAQSIPAKSGPAANARASSSTRANDRLQARLAKAMASKNGGSAAPSPSPRNSSDEAAGRGSTEGQTTSLDKTDPEQKPELAPEPETTLPQAEPSSTVLPDSADHRNIPSSGIDDSQGGSKNEEMPQAERVPEEPAKDDGDRELDDAKARHQQEIQDYVERIDSLQSKLQYMSKNAAEAAKTAASSAASGSSERKLAEKDERIALLMEEGQKLSGAEQQYRAAIKKLRLQLAEKDKQLLDAGQEKAKAVSEAEALRSRLHGDEEKEKRRQEAIKATAALRREIDGLKRDRADRDEAVRRLEQEAKAKLEDAAATHADALKRALAGEHERQRELESKSVSLAAELERTRQKTAEDDAEWAKRLQRAVDRGRSVEAELRAELKTMDGKLESMRAAAEEAASGSGGEAQAKLLRQMETLQTQYSSARENWQGIEASLLAKTGGLEKERDEAQRRESEMRKRARDAAGRCRALEEELQDTQPALAAAQRELEALREELAALRASSKASEAAVEQLRAEIKKTKLSSAARELSSEAEGRQWAEDVAGSAGRDHSRPESPLRLVARTTSSDMLGSAVPGRSRRVATPGSISDNLLQLAEGSGTMGGRRQQPLRSATLSTMSTTESHPPYVSPMSAFEAASEMMPRLLSSPPPPSLSLASPSTRANRENGITDTAPSSPRNLAHDMVSVCTVAAGPSVQLVERMSAAIRRLEGDKVTAKEEMARICAQRDEARADIAALMKDLEEARATAETVPGLRQQVEDLDARYQTTLELLGEKSELVDELSADVEDVKAMYRELVERAVK